MAMTAAQVNVKVSLEGADKTAAGLRSLGTETDNTAKKQGFLQSAMSTAVGVLGGGLVLGAIGQMKDLGASALGAGLDFEQGMANVSAVTGATGAELKQLSDLALQIGKDSSFGATEATLAIEELAKAGVSTQAILNGAADGATALAAAGGVALPEAASVMAAAMNQFGLGGDQAVHIADLLAAAASTSATGVSELGESLKYVGTTANQMGISIEDTITALAILGDNGLQGSVAGTSLNTALTSLINPSNEAATRLNELGFSLLDVNGNMKPLPQILTDLNTAFSGLSDGDRLQAIYDIFGTEGAKAIIPLLEAQSEGAKKAGKSWEDYYKSVNQDGAAAQQAAARMDSTMGSIEQLKGSLETLAIIGTMAVLPMFRGIVDGATKGVNAFTGFITSVQSLIAGGNDPFTAISLAMRGFLTDLFGLDVMNAAMPFVDGFLDIVQMIVDGIQSAIGPIQSALGFIFGFIGDHFATIAAGVAGVVAAFAGMAAISGILAAVGLAIAALTSPLLLVAAAAAALAMAYQTNFMGFADIVNGAVSAIASGLSMVAGIFGSLAGQMNPVAAAFATLGVLAAKLGTAFPALAGIFGPLTAGFTGLAGAAITFGQAIGKALLGDWSGALDTFRSGLGAVGTALGDFASIVPNVLGGLQGLATKGFDALARKFPAFANTFKALGQVINADLGVFKGLGSALSSLLKGDLSGAFDGLKDAATSALTGMVDRFKLLGNLAMDTFRAIDWGQVGDLLSTGFTNAIQGIGSAASGAMDWLGDALGDVNWGNVATGIGGAISDAFSAIDWDGVSSGIGNALQGLGDLALEGLQLAWDGLSSIDWGAVLGGAVDLASKFANWTVNDIPWKDLVSGAIDLASKFASWVVNDIPWKDLATGALDLTSKFGDWVINDIPWKELATGALDLASKFGSWVVNDIPWKDLATGALDLASKFASWVINDIPWKDIASGTLDLASKFASWAINDIPWSTILSGIEGLQDKFTSWVVNDIPWADLIAGTLDLAGKFTDWVVNDVPWGDIISGTLDLASKFTDWVVNDVPWTSIITGVADITQKFTDWVIPPIPWTSIITGAVNIGTKFASWVINDIPWTSIISGTWDVGTGIAAKITDLTGGLVAGIVSKLGISEVKLEMPSKQDILDAIIGLIAPAFSGGGGQSDSSARWNDHAPWGGNPTEGPFRGPTPGLGNIGNLGNAKYDQTATVTLNAVDNASAIVAALKANLLGIPPQVLTTLMQVGGEVVSAVAGAATAALNAVPPQVLTTMMQVGGEAVAAVSNAATAAINAIPTSHLTSITEAGAAVVTGAANAAANAIRAIPTSWSTTLSIAGAAAVESAANAAAAAIAAIPSSKTITISTVTGSARAIGGYVTGGLTRLAELGPELVAMPDGSWFMALKDALYPTPLGSYVYTAGQTNSMMGSLMPVPAYANGGSVGGRGSAPRGSSSPARPSVHVEIHGDVYGVDDLKQQIVAATAEAIVDAVTTHRRQFGG